MQKTNQTSPSRRRFMKEASLAAAGASAFTILQPRLVFGSETNSTIQMGIFGTGGRGEYDGRNLLKTGKVKIAALADYFDFQMKNPAEKFGVPAERCFSGIDGYKHVLALDDIDAVLMTTAPYFRPFQFEAAIDAGKHVFAEKPIAVDAPGCRQFLKAGEKAARKKLSVGAGLQSRNDEGRQRIAEMIQDGAIGKLLFGHSTRMGGDLWRHDRPAHFTERDHQIRHWLYYKWACGDFIVEMHVHNLDIFNWFAGMHPVSAVGKGGRDVRLDVGDIYDHISVVYEYPNGFHLTHTGSQIQKGYQGSDKQIVGSEGYYDEATGLFTKDKQHIEHGGIESAVELEMAQFIASVDGSGPYVNHSDYVTASTFTAILGREAAYQGRKITWDELWHSNERLEMPA
ncbi:MAG: Gfo/Idh/MocA family oxidoreductase [Candidatus Omnitrophota bacterium]